MRFFGLGRSIDVSRVTARTIVRVPRRVRKKGTTLRREVRRRNQCFCESECVEIVDCDSVDASEGGE